MPERIARRPRLQAGNRAPGSKRKAREARRYGIAAGAISAGLRPSSTRRGASPTAQDTASPTTTVGTSEAGGGARTREPHCYE
jgi:hypothetical protein